MYALIETSGSQLRVAEGDEIIVDRVSAEQGSNIELDKVLLLSAEDTTIGTPYVPGAKVTAEVVDHILGDKVETYKYRRARRYRKSIGFRARLSVLKIQSIVAE